MDASLPPEVIEQVHALADYARKNRYAQITILPNRKAYFQRYGVEFLKSVRGENKIMTGLRMLAMLWMAGIMIVAYLMVATSIFVPKSSLSFGWIIALMAAPWLSIKVTIGALFSEGPEAKSMMNTGFFLGALLISVGSFAKVQPVTTLFLVMGIPCLALAYFDDARRAAAWLFRRRQDSSSV